MPYNDYLKIKQIIQDYEDLIDLRKAKSETINDPFDKVKENIEKNKRP